VVLAVGCSAARPRPAQTMAPESMPWTSTFHRDLPLVGQIWQPSRATSIPEPTLFAALAQADYVLLGEQHDNFDHHRLQAKVILALVEAGKKPSVALEMLEPDDDDVIARYRANSQSTANGLGPQLDWEKRGWPAWAAYLPIAQVVFDADLPLLSANLPRAVVRAVAHQGKEALSPELAARLGLDQPLAPGLEESLEEELRSSHCGQLPETMIGSMALAQRARDGQMALRLLRSVTPVTLVAGAGHVRTDRGVPARIHAQEPSARVVSVAFVEVDPRRASPGDYASRFGVTILPFDFVWFTPRANDDGDPCERFPRIHGSPAP
jgi:uncharacterized iron-regulated protein